MTHESGLNPVSPADNSNVTWAELFVDELARCGMRHVSLAPGSRSTPLALAFSAHPLIRIYPHLDERSAAYFALGLAMAGARPVALLCTSGTAGVNFHPAIVEALHSQVPLLVLTADRPPELRHSGANQTIDQVKMYGDHVLWSVDVALPQSDAPPVALRNLRTLAARAVATADGLVKGPVHLNFPFRKPLEPAQARLPGPSIGGTDFQGGDTGPRPFTRISRGLLAPTGAQTERLKELLREHERGLIICGPRCPSGDFPRHVAELSERTGYPLFADALSGLRFGDHLEQHPVIGGYGLFLGDGEPMVSEPQVVIRFGSVPTSQALNRYLDEIQPVHRFHLIGDGVWADDSHRVTDFLQVDPTLACAQLNGVLEPRPGSGWAARIHEMEAACWPALEESLADDYFDAAVMADIVTGLPPGSALFVGNSLPVRHLDQFGRPHSKELGVYANRGASGIDGNVSTALGVGAALGRPVVAVLGDITLYHDLNGLKAIGALGLDVTIVLLNNGGGGIFHRLPIRQHEPSFTELFVMPHDLDFEPVAKMYGLDFIHAADRRAFQAAFAESMSDVRPRIIEVKTDRERDHARWQQVLSSVRNRLRQPRVLTR